MQKKTEYEPGDIKIEEQKEHYEQEDDLPWRNDRRGNSFAKSPLSIIGIGIGVVFMIIVCVFLIIRKPGDQESLSPQTPPQGQYEERQAEFIQLNQRLKTLDIKYKNIENFKIRLDDLEQSLALRLDQMEKKLTGIQTSFDQSKLQTKKEAAPTPKPTTSESTASELTPPKATDSKPADSKATDSKPATSKPTTSKPTSPPQKVANKVNSKPKPVLTPKPEVQSPAPKFSRKHYHKVSANETLFSISRRYKMKIDELRTLNKMNKSDKIQLGQILIVNLPEND